MNNRPRVTFAVCALLSWVYWHGSLAAAPAQTAEQAWLANARLDAELHDVCFVDASHGWAVGDRGVIWHTDDGGAHWRQQASGVDLALRSVHFLDAQQGWIAGGWRRPYTHLSEGVLLHTVDGGNTWRADRGLLLPSLRKIGFFDAQRGWAMGDSSPQFPTGVFITGDGGRSWSAATGAAGSWLAADFIDPQTGAIAGRRGALATARGGTLQPSRTPPLGLRALCDIKLSPGGGWLVGEGGLVLTSHDLGTSWQQPAGEIRQPRDAPFDWRAVSTWHEHCWIAGAPGTTVLHSADGGQTWDHLATGQSLPIGALEFIDAQRGWAVGALGTVLSTSDGGRSWQRQRAGGARAAALAIFSEAETVPLEMITRLAGQDGYLLAVELLARRDVEPAGNSGEAASAADRATAAMLSQGASSTSAAWRFPLRQQGVQRTSEQVVAGFNAANDGQGIQQLDAWLVRQIRAWRPSVIITHSASPRGDDPVGHVINQLVLQAVEHAADPTRLPEQLVDMGLEPWSVQRVLGSLPPGEQGTVSISTAQFAGALGGSLAQQADAARALLHRDYAGGPESLGFRLLVDRTGLSQGGKDIFSGIAIPAASDARRAQVAASPWAVEEMRRMAQQQRNVRAILDRADESTRDPGHFMAHVAPLTATLDDDSAAGVLHQLGDYYWRSGRWPQAAETFDALLTRFPDHPLAPAAARWLAHYWASGEAARRFATASGVQLVQYKQHATAMPAAALAGETDQQQIADRIDRAVGAVHHDPQAVDRAERAAELGKLIANRWPGLYQQPKLRFALNAAERRRGFGQAADRYLQSMLATSGDDAWRRCAAAEQWLQSDRTAHPPMPVENVRRSGQPPHLDGVLDEPVWQRARSLELTSAQHDDGAWPTVAQLAYDEQFLYLAVRCRKAPAATYTAAKGPRPRDADLSASDRVELLLDIDGDRATWYRLSVDHRGHAHDSCWGDSSWNPAWYIASASDEQTWTVEAAIPLAELATSLPQSQTVWAAQVQRIVPGAGFQAWSRPAETTGLGQGLGYLIFE